MTPLPAKPVGVRVIAIAAMAQNRAIGSGNALPWHIPEDLKFFRESTRGKTLLMGRKTYASIGRPLPGRRTIVLSRSATPIAGVEVITNLSALPGLLGAASELWICGGAEIYSLTMPWWDELFLSRVKRTVEGDAFFPSFEHRLILADELRDTKDFSLVRYVPGG